jgi:hypothetical protein
MDIRDVRMGFDRRWLDINHRAVLLSLSYLVAMVCIGRWHSTAIEFEVTVP